MRNLDKYKSARIFYWNAAPGDYIECDAEFKKYIVEIHRSAKNISNRKFTCVQMNRARTSFRVWRVGTELEIGNHIVAKYEFLPRGQGRTGVYPMGMEKEKVNNLFKWMNFKIVENGEFFTAFRL